MHIQIAALADGANITNDDKLNILGVFDKVLVHHLPCQMADMCLAIRLAVGAQDVGRHELSVRVRNSDRKTVDHYDTVVTVHPLGDDEIGYVNHVVPILGLVLDDAMGYSFDIRWDSRVMASVPLRAVMVESDDSPEDEGDYDAPSTPGPGGRWFGAV